MNDTPGIMRESVTDGYGTFGVSSSMTSMASSTRMRPRDLTRLETKLGSSGPIMDFPSDLVLESDLFNESV